MKWIRSIAAFLTIAVVLLGDVWLEEFHNNFQRAGHGRIVTRILLGVLVVLLGLNYGPVLRSWKKNRPAVSWPRVFTFAFLGFMLVSYALDAARTWQGLRVDVILLGLIFGQIASMLFNGENFRARFLLVFGAALAVTVFAHYPKPGGFQYRGHARWTGMWQNPNTFGLLMAVGLTLAVGQWLVEMKNKWKAIVFGVIAALAAVGLLESYSRGAWVGALCGLGFLFYQHRQVLTEQFPVIRLGQRHWLVLGLIFLSLAALAWWRFHESDVAAARRVVSVSNPNDLSWRNRVNSWVGGLQMISEKPWLGFGWREPDGVYAQFYRVPFYGEHDPAILFNDYIVIAAIFGLWPLVSFLGLVGSYFAVEAPKGLRVTCRAVALILLVGFFFDGGLFKIAPAITFWVFLELGYIRSCPSNALGEAEFNFRQD